MPAALAQDLNLHRAVDLFAREQSDEIIGAGNGNPVEREDHVARPKSRRARRDCPFPSLRS